jgi:hypothetical protein
MESVLSHLKTYDLTRGYFSSVYGWTFFFITYVILKPISLIPGMFHGQNQTILYMSIRLIHFSIYFISIIVLYFLLNRLCKIKLLVFLGCVLFIIPMYSDTTFTMVHPESTGIMFLLFGLITLDNFRNSPNPLNNNRMFYGGIVLLALSAFSKQLFVFTAIPIYFLFLQEYALSLNLDFYKFITSRVFFKILCTSCIYGLATFIIIHPFAILKFHAVLKAQLETVRAHGSSQLAVPIFQAWKAYGIIISNNPYLLLSIIICAYNIYYYTKMQKDIFLRTICISTLGLILLIISNARLVIDLHYFEPIAVFLVISNIKFIEHTFSIEQKKNKQIYLWLVGFSLFILLAFRMRFIVDYISNDLNYKQGNPYQINIYISERIPQKSKLAVAHCVAIPPGKDIKIFNWWQNDPWKISEFEPDYVIFPRDFGLNGKPADSTIAFCSYIDRGGYTLVKIFGDLRYPVGEYSIKCKTVSMYRKTALTPVPNPE